MSKLVFTGPHVDTIVQRSIAAAAARRPTFGQQVERVMKAKGLTDDAAMDFLFSVVGSSPEWHAAGPDIPPGLWFVKDDGIYLLSNAQLVDGGNPLVVYATGYGPGNYDRCVEAVGGDDFCEFIPITDWPTPVGYVVIQFSPTELTIEAFGRAPVQAREAS